MALLEIGDWSRFKVVGWWDEIWEMVRAPQQPHSATANKQTGAQLPAVRDPASPLYRVSKACIILAASERKEEEKKTTTSIRHTLNHPILVRGLQVVK